MRLTRMLFSAFLLTMLISCAQSTPVAAPPTATPIAAVNTPTPPPTSTPTDTPTREPTATPTTVPTDTNTPAPTDTLTPTTVPTESPTSTATATVTDTVAPTETKTPTVAASPSATPKPTSTTVPPAPTAAAIDLTVDGSICDIEHVVIISVDGLRPDAMAQAETPVLDSLQANGAYTAEAEAVLPTVTLINHASMFGGMGPDKHGISWNSANTGNGKINGPTLFTIANEAGLSTALVAGKPKLEDVVLPGSVDQYIYAGFTDSMVLADTLPVFDGGLPNVVGIHLPDVDSAGHSGGWMSLAQLLVISWTDSVIGQMVADLEAGGYLDRTLIIITSDHGGSGTSHGSASPEDQIIPWLMIGPGVPAGSTIEQPVIVYDTAATAAYALGLDIPAEWDGQPVFEAMFDEEACP